MAVRKKGNSATPVAAQTDPRAQLDIGAFLASAQRVLAILRDDLLERADKSQGVTEALKAQWQAEHDAKQTGDDYEPWRRRVVVQIGAAWILSVVFARTLEDRGLVDRNRIAGSGATDSQRQFLDLAPYLTERDYLLTVFRELSNLPVARELFDPEHNPVWKLAPSAEGTRTLLDLFRVPDAETPAFRFGQIDTRFLGDLYQDLDEETRERFALLQTPHFVESFILDQTLEPAIREYGLSATTLIDPTCGSGHFLLGAFDRLLDHHLREHPGIDVREGAKRALDAVHGVDLNPYAVAIARFRLTLAFLERGGYSKLAGAPELPMHVVVADSLLHGRGSTGQATFAERPETAAKVWLGEIYSFVDESAAKEVLGKQYAAVVGNPPYITVKDSALREAYRTLYPRSAAGKYSLGAPFTERFFDLAREGGFAGMITANSFMKREFGKKLVEDYLKSVDLRLIVNTSGAHIPGHGTPTVLVFGRHRAPVEKTVLAVLAKRGEPSTPPNAEDGVVWRSIADHFEEVGFENDYVSVATLERLTLARHPWSLGGGGAAELKELLDERSEKRLRNLAESVGITSFTLEDEVYLRSRETWLRHGVQVNRLRPMIIGEAIRDWDIHAVDDAFFPYNEAFEPISENARELRALWPFRTNLSNNVLFGGKTKVEGGLKWFEFGRLTAEKLRTPLAITFAEVATHNHFAFNRGGVVFKQTAPIIKLADTATENSHLALLGYLNSSTACFWLKQVAMNKGGSGIGRGVQDEAWEGRFQFDSTKLQEIPIPGEVDAVVPLVEQIQSLAASRASRMPVLLLSRLEIDALDAIHGNVATSANLLACMCALQEELDWIIYEAFGLLTNEDLALLRPAREKAFPGFPAGIDTTADAVPSYGLHPGHRPFEIVLARDCLRSNGQTSWFTRNGYISPSEISSSYSPELLRLLSARVTVIDRNAQIRLLEQPEYKRRWTLRSWATEFNVAARDLLATAAEKAFLSVLAPLSERQLAESVVADARMRAISDSILPAWHDFGSGLGELIANEAVPFLAALRHTESGLEKHAAWQRTWRLQRDEDAEKITSAPPTTGHGAFVGKGSGVSGAFASKDGSVNGAFLSNRVVIPVPPKYDSKDYRTAATWRLRGKLDVPKERFISYPRCESDEDKSPVFGWAGWNHLQQAQALSSLYQKRKTEDAWTKDRLVPMLAGIDELVPWVKQWHNESSTEFGGIRLGDYFADFVAAQCQELGVTLDQLRAWRPDARTKVSEQQTQSAELLRPNVTPDQEAILLILALIHTRSCNRTTLARAFTYLYQPALLAKAVTRQWKPRTQHWSREVKGRTHVAGQFRAALALLLSSGVLQNVLAVDGTPPMIRIGDSAPNRAEQDPWWFFEAELSLAVVDTIDDEALARLSAKVPAADRDDLREVG